MNKRVKGLASKGLRLLRKKSVQKGLTVAVIVFVFLNVATFVVYRQKSYPNTRAGGTRLGSVTFAQLPETINDLSLLPAEVTISIQDKTEQIDLERVGIAADEDKIAQQVIRQRSWLPLLNLFTEHISPIFITADEDKLAQALSALDAKHQKVAVDARILLKDVVFSLQNQENGYLLDVENAKSAILTALEKGQTAVALPTRTLEPQHNTASLATALNDLQSQQKTPVTYTFAGQKRELTASEVTSWFEPSDVSYVLSDAKIRGSIIAVGVGFGISVKNLDQAVAETKQALLSQKALSFAFEPAPLKQKTYSYCVAGRGVPESHLAGLISKLAAVFGDSRGWGLNGQVRLTKADTGCGFTVWLSAADQMPSFGPICDANWSGRVGTNVVINFDRWQGASDAWNKSGGSLDDYRSMVINHETGHWLGFGHHHCAGPGQAAPVMQQQSINLEGCTFNPWPLASERASLKKTLDL